jgi:rod shape determining protein RodA
MARTSNIWRRVDWIAILLYTLLVFGGWVSIYAASYNFDNASIFSYSERSGKQLLWIGLSFVIAFILLMIDDKIYDIFAYHIYTILILLLIATIFLAPETRGSRSWLIIGPMSIQPAEFAKFATSLALAKLFAAYNFDFFKNKNYLKTIALILIPFICILLQKETGSALVYLSLMLALYREGMSGMILFSAFWTVVFFVLGIKYGDVMFWGQTPAGEFLALLLMLLVSIGLILFYLRDFKTVQYVLCVIVAAFIGSFAFSRLLHPVNHTIVEKALLILLCGYMLVLALRKKSKHYLLITLFAIFSAGFLYSVDYVFDNILEPHQQTRIKVTLGMEDDPRGAGYNVNQSKIAIGSGGFNGKGFLNGTQTKLKYVPEQDTDFIFCTIGEEEGFLGTFTVMLLFLTLILRIIHLAEQQRTIFARVYGYSVASILFFHVAINVGMVIGLTPVIGIPLPFFSYGGSSLWSFTILLFIFLRIDASKLEKAVV